MRDVNAEINQHSLARCPSCGDRILGDPVSIQRHFMERHNIAEQLHKKEKGWNFQRVARIVNPLSLTNIFGRA